MKKIIERGFDGFMRFASSKSVTALKDGFVLTMPATLIGSLFLLIANLPIPGYGAFMTRLFGPDWSVGLDQVSACTFDILAMIIAGAVIGELNLKNMLLKKRTYYIIAMKLLVFPAIFCLILRFLPLEEMVKLIMGMLAACPSGAIGIMLAILYKRDDHYAAEIFAMTTLFSIVTIPLCMFLL